MQTRVKEIKKHKEANVCKGKLVLIPIKSSEANKKCIYVGVDNYLKPIIVSYESPEVKDYMFIDGTDKIYLVTGKNNQSFTVYEKDKYAGDFAIDNMNVRKVLALPENFSDKIFQDIVDGKLQNDDEVLLECGEYEWEETGISKHTYKNEMWYPIKLTNNQINIIAEKEGVVLKNTVKLDVFMITKLFCIEYKLKTGGYHSIGLGGGSQKTADDITIFDVDFHLNFKTYCVCKRTIVNRENRYEIIKIITITDVGSVLEFKSPQEFLDYIKEMNEIETAYYYK